MSAMYHQYFGLNEAPFSIAVNPRYLFMSARHRDALAHLLYGVGAGGGFILLTGEVGTGKTTINRCLLEQLPHDTDIAIILNPALNAMELLATACDELGISYDADDPTLKRLTDALHAFLLENHARGRKTVLMIDEAQHLDFDVLEQIRLLTNLETNSEKLLQIILIGQPELAQLLARPELRQLNQRITARYNLEPLNLSETRAYIHHRLQVAGMTPDRVIFPPRVVKGIYRRTRGIPRLINVLCDRILLGAYGRNKNRADMAMLRIAAREVMGEETPARQGAGWLPGFAAAVGLAALLGAGLWWWQGHEAAVSQPPTAAATVPPAQAVSEVAVVESEPSAPEASGDTAPVALPTVWLLPPEEAREKLWSLYAVAAYPGDLCDRALTGDLACVIGEALTWNELERLDRPVLLDMVTPERFAAGAVLLGVEDRSGWALGREGELMEVPLGELAGAWTGGYRFLWQPPEGFDVPLALGDESPVVAQVARLFAQLDGQAQPLTGDLFTAALQQRVELFQRSQGLEDDGVVGAQTLLKLNAALGIDPSARVLRQQLALNAGDAQ